MYHICLFKLCLCDLGFNILIIGFYISGYRKLAGSNTDPSISLIIILILSLSLI